MSNEQPPEHETCLICGGWAPNGVFCGRHADGLEKR
jgi:hypothetical protein